MQTPLKRKHSSAFQEIEENAIVPIAYKAISPFRRQQSKTIAEAASISNSPSIVASATKLNTPSNKEGKNECQNIVSNAIAKRNLTFEQDLQTSLESLRNEEELPCDTLLHIQLLKQSLFFHSQHERTALPLPILLKHQIYASMEHQSRTQIDMELDKLRMNNEIKIFKLTGREEFAVMLSIDYKVHVQQTKDAMIELGVNKSLQFFLRILS